MNTTEQSIAEDICNNLSEDDATLLSQTPFDECIQFHHTVGQWIRNNYKLWDKDWIPVFDDDGIDHSPDHPDAVSQRIIERVWKQVNNENS